MWPQHLPVAQCRQGAQVTSLQDEDGKPNPRRTAASHAVGASPLLAMCTFTHGWLRGTLVLRGFADGIAG